MDYPELLKGYKNELVKLQDLLLKERENRETDEHHSVELLTKVKKQYDLRFEQLKKDSESQSNEFNYQISELQNQVDELTFQLKDQQDYNKQLVQNEVTLKKKLDQAILDQNNMREQLDSFVSADSTREERQELDANKEESLKHNFENENVFLQQNELLESKLIELEDCRRDIDQLKISVNHKENEISNLKLDLRLAKREASREQDHSKFLRESNRELKERITSLESQLKQHESDDSSKNSEFEDLKNTQEKLKQRNDELEEKIKFFEDREKSLNEEISNLKASIRSKDEALVKQRTINLKLKNVTQVQEEQNDKYQVIIDEMLVNKEKLMNENEQLIEKIDIVNKDCEEQKAKLEIANKNLIDLQELMNKTKTDLEQENVKLCERIVEFEKKLFNEKANNSNYQQEIECLQKECYEKDRELKESDQRISQIISNLNEIKEERSKILTFSEELKKENFSLAKMCDDRSHKYHCAKNNISELLKEIDSKTSELEIEKIKFQTTIDQMLKLIKHLEERETNAATQKSWLGVSKSLETDYKSPSLLISTLKKREEDEYKQAYEREKQKNEILKEELREYQRKNKRRKNEKVAEEKIVATAPSIGEEEVTDVASKQLESNDKRQVPAITEEEFTFTDSIMEELAYKDE